MKLWQIKDLYPKANLYDPSSQDILLLKELEVSKKPEFIAV